MPYETVALEVFHTNSQNAISQVLDITMYEKVDVNGTEYFGDFDQAKARFDPWTSGGGHYEVKITDKAPGTNPPGLLAKHEEAREWIRNHMAFWQSTLQAAGLVVNERSQPIDPVPDATSVDVYVEEQETTYSKTTRGLFRSNNPAVVTLLLQAYAQSAPWFEEF